MRSKIAEETRKAQIEDTKKLTPAERARLALDLGESALELYMSAHGVSHDEALAVVYRSSQTGRRRSCANG